MSASAVSTGNCCFAWEIISVAAEYSPWRKKKSGQNMKVSRLPRINQSSCDLNLRLCDDVVMKGKASGMNLPPGPWLSIPHIKPRPGGTFYERHLRRNIQEQLVVLKHPNFRLKILRCCFSALRWARVGPMFETLFCVRKSSVYFLDQYPLKCLTVSEVQRFHQLMELFFNDIKKET